MNRSIGSIVVYGLIGLAVFGLVTSLFTDTIGLLKSLFITLLIGAAIFGLVYFFFLRRRTPNELRKYRKAVKQSKQKYKNQQSNNGTNSSTVIRHTTSAKKAVTRPLKPTKRDASHLRVIEGNKHKKKNRASL
ncbi:SA1362 family protein [Gracilibacillus sp. S3-1-1]|uniref:SA1362 family protein n=1 Tax=Gracilibacillus pellucidus TaxID=3095368 RepID=A0ACC6M525_9BACI|nr:SA1362 family protein [Gracilibacillus sp. S3-1-1]MDX8046010.1 SA1362 family protein [Gracilibacillus sp. S3-1-1]